MSVKSDPAMVKSGFERIEKERYFTEPWVSAVLTRRVDVERLIIWEPSAGRGDMAQVFSDHGATVIASDIDLSEFNPSSAVSAMEADFLTAFTTPEAGVDAIITNPPYDKAEEFIRKALSFVDVDVVAMLLRSEFNSASTRSDLFKEGSDFAFEIVLTSRPRWDWWFRDKPEASPRHNFSWFVWDRRHKGPSTQYWEGKLKPKKETKIVKGKKLAA